MPTSKGREGKGGEEMEGRKGLKERVGRGVEGRAGEGRGCPVFLLSRPGDPSGWSLTGRLTICD